MFGTMHRILDFLDWSGYKLEINHDFAILLSTMRMSALQHRLLSLSGFLVNDSTGYGPSMLLLSNSTVRNVELKIPIKWLGNHVTTRDSSPVLVSHEQLWKGRRVDTAFWRRSLWRNIPELQGHANPEKVLRGSQWCSRDGFGDRGEASYVKGDRLEFFQST